MRLALTAALALGAAVHAAPLRLAVVYGHNGGTAVRPPLRYAEADAARVGALLTELGGVAAADLRLLQGRPVAELFDALDWARGRATSNPETLLFVYLSAHAEAGAGLLPGEEQLAWRTLKERVAATGARVRVTVVDGCHSAGLLEAGARAAPSFSLVAEELTVKGEAFLTSSARNEPSLEAGAFRGSVFTQHLLAGLRGAADRSGDQRISLDEAYRYAFERSVEGESGQHPGFANRLAGYGDLVLTSLTDDRTGVLVPPGLESLGVRTASGERFVFARRPVPGRLAVPPGEWVIELTRQGRVREGRVTVARGFSGIDEGELSAAAEPTRVVRLGAEGPCLDAVAPREDPAVLSLRDALKAASAPGCDAARAVTLTVDRVKGRLRVRGDGFEQQGAPAEEAALVEAARRWARGRQPGK